MTTSANRWWCVALAAAVLGSAGCAKVVTGIGKAAAGGGAKAAPKALPVAVPKPALAPKALPVTKTAAKSEGGPSRLATEGGQQAIQIGLGQVGGGDGRKK